VNQLRAHLVREEADFGTDLIRAKIPNAERARVCTMLVIGPRGVEAGQVRVHLHHGAPEDPKLKVEVIAGIFAGVRERRANWG